ncbi:hypothetical protein RJT34_10618 [Clitoria ternatea]|uniref:Uncharacterized protein n=1 Tax=Clitoria ternatea TaxID=43366 RepID=A0AAN9JID7_CLITE
MPEGHKNRHMQLPLLLLLVGEGESREGGREGFIPFLDGVVKIRLQQQKGLSPELLRYKGPIHCAGMIIKEEGFCGQELLLL